jgi:excisionase family DNA binding protein
VSAKPAAKIAVPHFISLKDAATRLGYAEFTMRELVASGRLPAYRINDKPGSTIRVKVSDVDALMKPLIPAEVYGDRDSDGGAK